MVLLSFFLARCTIDTRVNEYYASSFPSVSCRISKILKAELKGRYLLLLIYQLTQENGGRGVYLRISSGLCS